MGSFREFYFQALKRGSCALCAFLEEEVGKGIKFEYFYDVNCQCVVTHSLWAITFNLYPVGSGLLSVGNYIHFPASVKPNLICLRSHCQLS